MYTVNNNDCQPITRQRYLQQTMENCHCETLHQSQKKGTAYTNYRPVSNLPFISKVVERCTLQQLMQHCNNHTLLPDFQSAYQKHHSCKTSLLKLTNNILWGMENQQATAMIILDLSAAFNTVDHEQLLQVLNHKFGVTGMALEWYKNYLIPRKFKVSINGIYSNEKTMNFSVPQGSVQGAFLFMAYDPWSKMLWKMISP